MLLPVTDTDSMRAILDVFRGAPSDDTVNPGGAVALPNALVRRLGSTIAHLVTADDSTTPPPAQKQIGIVPPDDPTCR